MADSWKGVFALWSVSLSACGKLAGLDDYEVGEQRDGAAQSAYAKVSSIFGAGACAQCVAGKCDVEIRRCVENEACVADAECLAACSDTELRTAPQCFNECGRNAFLGASLDVQLCVTRCERSDGGGCVAECEEECSLGRRFACAGRYELGTAASPDEFDQVYRLAEFGTTANPGDFDNLKVYMCAIDDATCGTGEAQLSGTTGTVTLRNLSRPEVGAVWRPMPFAIQVGEPGTRPSGRYLFTTPLAEKGGLPPITLLMVPLLTLPSDGAFLNGVTLDCLPSAAWGARGVVIETTPPANISYGVGTGDVIVTGGASTDVQGTWFANTTFQEGAIDLVMRDATTAVELARARPLLKAGYWNTGIIRLPPSDSP